MYAMLDDISISRKLENAYSIELYYVSLDNTVQEYPYISYSYYLIEKPFMCTSVYKRSAYFNWTITVAV